LTLTIKQTFTYVARHEKGIQHPLLTLKLGSGSCRDLAMLMIEAVRSLGMAARFVSGYLHVPDRDGRLAVIRLDVPGFLKTLADRGTPNKTITDLPTVSTAGSLTIERRGSAPV
jgi:hypothetical protein